MPDKSVTKVSSEHAPKGRFGQKYLASGIHISMRLWEREQPAEEKPETARDYETDWSSRERPSCILKANSCYWKKAILGWCRKAHGTLTRLSKPLLQLKRPAHLRRCMGGTNNHLLVFTLKESFEFGAPTRTCWPRCWKSARLHYLSDHPGAEEAFRAPRHAASGGLIKISYSSPVS